jgi:hypothetical protein
MALSIFLPLRVGDAAFIGEAIEDALTGRDYCGFIFKA